MIRESAIKSFVDNELMFDDVKSFIKDYIASSASYDIATSNEQLGAQLRGHLLAEEIINKSFQEMQKYRTIKEINQSNPAR